LNNLLKKSKTYFIVDDDIDDQQFLAEALAGTIPIADALPLPMVKKQLII